MIDRHAPTYIIGLDGTLRQLPAYLVPGLQKQGWVLVQNPRRTYYPEYDRTNPNWKESNSPEKEIDVLKVEVL